MNARLILVYILISVSLLLSACYQAPKQLRINISCDDFLKIHPKYTVKKETKINPEDSITVTLCSNPTTGFKWKLAGVSDKSILEYVDNKYVAPEAEGLVGASGKELWIFKALKKGKSTIHMEYSRPWERGKKAEWAFVLTVIVKEPHSSNIR
ncbi:MAG: protease inhibitor I42 family protein [Candidatus Aminicenantaceae bacterium]